jgi:hypothetical protein
MKYKQMKRLTATLFAAAVATLISACATETGAVVTSGPGPALLAAGFKVRASTTPAQRERLRTMPDDTFTVVRQGGETYYLYPDKGSGQLYAGDVHAYREYRRNVEMQRLREEGAFVIDAKPRGHPVITVWHGWSPFREW